MSAISLRHIKRDFSQVSYRPDIEDEDLADILRNILVTSGLMQQYRSLLYAKDAHSIIKVVKHICQLYYSKNLNVESVNEFLIFLARMYTNYCFDEKVLRAVTKCIKSCPENWKPDLATAILHQLLLFLDYRVNDIRKAEYFSKILNDCCEHFPEIIHNSIEKFLAFLILYLNNSNLVFLECTPPQKIAAIKCIHEGFRFFLAAYKRKILPNNLSFVKELNKCFIDILDTDNLPMETLFNGCLSVLYSNVQYVCSAIDCWKISIDLIINHSDLVKLGFCIAILNSFSSEDLQIVDIDTKKPIFINLYDIITDVSFNNLNDSCITLASSRALLVYSKRLCTGHIIELEEHHLANLFAFIWLRMDHFLDGVRHLARDTMINIIKISDGNILTLVLERLSLCDQHSKAFFTVLTLMSDKVNQGLIMKYLPNIAEDLLNLMSSNNSALPVFIRLMTNHYNITESDQWFGYWLHPLFQNAEKLDAKNFEQIITKAIELSPGVSKHILDFSNQNDLPLNINLICFKIEKNNYLANNEIVYDESWLNQANIAILKRALHSNDENIRFIAVNLILDCPKKTQPFTKLELELITYFITYNVKHEQPSIKQTNLSLIKKALLRIKESLYSVTVKNNESLRITITEFYKDFQKWLSEFCFQNLSPGSSFSRRNFALESLCLLQMCLSPTGIIGLCKFSNVSLLLNCLWDTYEQNKKLAKNIIIKETLTAVNLKTKKVGEIDKISKKLVSTTSPPDCITAGYLLEIVNYYNQKPDCDIYKYVIVLELMTILQKEIMLAEESVTLASARGPMYGSLHTIRHMLNTVDWQASTLGCYWFTCLNECINFSFKCSKLVSFVINDSSPEGIIPMDDLYRTDSQVTSQMVLLCCWHTAKESALLLGDIVCIFAELESEYSDTLITKIFSSLALMLTESKHRGAFEQIYVAYLKVCAVLWKSPTLHKIPQKYLENILTEIKFGLNEIYCVTRRSAGMPFIIQALICSIYDKRKVVNYTMEVLIEICESKTSTEEEEVRVVHALNVLRALFRCSQLGDVVGAFVSKAFEISIVLFNSSSWPIRNSSTLLLSALVNRVFGVLRSSTELSWKNRMTGREFFERYPKLFEIFLNEFKKFSPLDMSPSLYPTLLILARLYPSATENTDCIVQLADYIPYIYKCAQSPVMKTRMLAGTAIAPQVTQIKLIRHLTITFHELTNISLNENTKHGLLIQIFCLVENLPKLEPDDLNKLVSLTENLAMKYSQFTNCSYVVREIFLRCITCLWFQLDMLPYNSIEPIYKLTLDTILEQIQRNNIGKSKYLESATFFLFSISIKTETDFSIIAYKIMESKMHCPTIFKVLNIILSEKPIEFYEDVEKFVNLKYWNRDRLMNQLLANNSLIELISRQCTIKDSLIHEKYLVLSKFTPALVEYFKVHESIEDFISNVLNLKKDVDVSNALLCIDGYLQTLNSLEQSLTTKLTQVFENMYCAQQSDDCKIACIDIIVNNYDLLIKNNMMLDCKMFLKLWMILINYSEDNSEEVRKHVWCLLKSNANCIKSYELLFVKFIEFYNQYPSAVIVAFICLSYFGVETPQVRQEGQVFDSEDTSKYKELEIRQGLARVILSNLTSSEPQAFDLEINHQLQEWITEEWTCDIDVKPGIQSFKTTRDFMDYAKDYHLKMIAKQIFL